MGGLKHSKRFIYLAGFITLIGLGGAGVAILYYFQDSSLSDIFVDHIHPIYIQILIGSAYGLLASFILVFLLRKKMLDATRYFFSDLIKKYSIGVPEIIFVSLCAGIGEELFFRAAIQPWLGIWLTALIFIFLHGYLNPRDKAMFIYGIVLMIFSAGFGYLMLFSGIYAAMMAHAIIDIILMMNLKSTVLPELNQEKDLFNQKE